MTTILPFLAVAMDFEWWIVMDDDDDDDDDDDERAMPECLDSSSINKRRTGQR